MGTDAEITTVARLAIAALIGLAVGFEREQSGHASGPQARFAGIRTFLLIGVLGGCAGLLLALSQALAASALLLGGSLFVVAAYVMAVRRPEMELEGTTEAAALAVLALGAIAGVGEVALAAGTGAIIVLALSEKVRLHWLVRRVAGSDFRAGLQFAVLALVILPLLPVGPFGGVLDVRPRSLWTVVLLFSGLNFLGYLARKAAGPERGYALTGMLGGLVSSTAVAIGFSRRSRSEPALDEALAGGVVGACVILLPRVLVVAAVLNPAVALALLPLLGPALVVGTLALVLIWKRRPLEVSGAESARSAPANPLQLGSAIRMAIAFQVALSLIAMVRTRVDSMGLYATGAALGLTDVDALTFAMSRAGGRHHRGRGGAGDRDRHPREHRAQVGRVRRAGEDALSPARGTRPLRAGARQRAWTGLLVRRVHAATLRLITNEDPKVNYRIVSLVVAAVIIAAPSTRAQGMEHTQKMGGDSAAHAQMMAKLNLTADQKTQIDAIHRKYDMHMDGGAHSPDMAGKGPTMQSDSTMKRAMAEVRAVLHPDQQVLFDSMMTDHMKHHSMHDSAGHPGMKKSPGSSPR